MLGVASTNITRFEDDGTQTVVGAWAASGAPWFPTWREMSRSTGKRSRGSCAGAARPQRVDDYTGVRGELVK